MTFQTSTTGIAVTPLGQVSGVAWLTTIPAGIELSVIGKLVLEIGRDGSSALAAPEPPGWNHGRAAPEEVEPAPSRRLIVRGVRNQAGRVVLRRGTTTIVEVAVAPGAHPLAESLANTMQTTTAGRRGDEWLVVDGIDGPQSRRWCKLPKLGIVAMWGTGAPGQESERMLLASRLCLVDVSSFTLAFVLRSSRKLPVASAPRHVSLVMMNMEDVAPARSGVSNLGGTLAPEGNAPQAAALPFAAHAPAQPPAFHAPAPVSQRGPQTRQGPTFGAPPPAARYDGTTAELPPMHEHPEHAKRAGVGTGLPFVGADSDDPEEQAQTNYMRAADLASAAAKPATPFEEESSLGATMVVSSADLGAGNRGLPFAPGPMGAPPFGMTPGPAAPPVREDMEETYVPDGEPQAFPFPAAHAPPPAAPEPPPPVPVAVVAPEPPPAPPPPPEPIAIPSPPEPEPPPPDPGPRADLERRVREGLSLDGLDLKGAALAGISLRNVQLIGLDLSLADLTNADLTAADLTRSKLDSAKLDGAKLDGATLMRASMEEASLKGASLRNAQARDWVAVEADLEGADLSNADLRRARLVGARLVQIVGKALNGHEADFTGADLSGANFEQASLRAAVLRRTNLEGTSFKGADLRDADLREAQPDASLTGAKLAGSRRK